MKQHPKMISSFKPIYALVLCLMTHVAYAQFSAIELAPSVIQHEEQTRPFPTEYSTFLYNPQFIANRHKTSLIDVSIPLGNGIIEQFTLEPYDLMPEKLALKFPSFRTYTGSSSTGHRIFADITEKGFHAVIRTTDQTYYIDPIGDSGSNQYIVYSTEDYSKRDLEIETFQCATEAAPILDQVIEDETIQQSNISFRGGEPVIQRTYILALATTIEYCQFHGGTVSQAMSAMVTAMNRVNSVFNVDMAVKIVLHENTDELIFCDGVDPFTNGNTGVMIDENPPAIRSRIPSNTYDFGHVFCTNGGGLAQLRSICSSSKERGVTCHSSPINDPFYIGYVSHEMGHQFGGNHIFNALSGSCMTNINNGTAYEPGSGSSIMSYAGICAGDNTVNNSDAYYNSHSLTEIHDFINQATGGDQCPERTVTDNTPPSIPKLYADDLNIPISTPIELVGNASDMEDENLTYTWEQHDLGPQANLGFPVNGLGPLFRSYRPSQDPNRIIPKVGDLIRNISSRTEVLPTVSRPLTFRFTVRDNHENGGGVTWTDVAFDVTENAGPFLVSSYNDSGNEFITGQRVELLWDVANTDQAPVNCQFVNIYYSTDGGETFPFLMAERAPNNGQIFVTVPDIITDDFRFKIKGDKNIFFDINNRDIDIVERTDPGFAFDITPRSQFICAGQDVDFGIQTSSFLGFSQDISYRILSDLPEGITAENEGQITPGQNANLVFGISPFINSQQLNVEIEVLVAGVDTSLRNISLDIVSSDYRDQSLDEPVDGLMNANKSQMYNWTSSINANSYRFELSDDVLFSNILYTEDNITSNELDISSFELASSTTYYWRITPTNLCGEGPYSNVSSFRTGTESCTSFDSQDVPKLIDGGAPNTATSELTILDNFIIDDLNVSSLTGVHGNIGQLSFVLISPNATRVQLFSRVCNFQTSFDLRLDDDVLTDVNCPINTNAIYRPIQFLSVFNGENAEGIWTLEVNDASQGLGGNLNAWGLEFCAAMSIPAPTLVRNNVLIIDEQETKTVSATLLEVSDDNAGPADLIYTLTNVPAFGTLLLNDQVMTIGATYSQSDINSGALEYRHTANHAEDDLFKFEVTNPDGGWLGGVNFMITVNKVVATTFIAEDVNIKINPNPASDYFHIQMPTDLNQDMALAIYDMTGKLILRDKNLTPGERRQINTHNWSTGIYSLLFISNEIRAVKKMVITK